MLRIFTLNFRSPITCWLVFLVCQLDSVAVAQNLEARQTSSNRVSQPNVDAQPLVMAHYMPWFSAKPQSDQWGWHWTMNHFDPEQIVDDKRQIASKQYPLIGPYDSGDPDVLEYHLLTMKIAGIDGVIVDWYGLADFRDYAMLHRNTTRLLQQCERLNMKFIICYEDQTIPALVEGNRLTKTKMVQHAIDEIDWLGQYWFKSGSYVKLDGRPVLLSFGHAGLNDQQWAECLSGLKTEVAYFSQDYRRSRAVGAFGWPAPKVGLQQVDNFLRDSRSWDDSIPAAFPRFDDIYAEAGVGEGYPTLPDDSGRTLRLTFEKAQASGARIIQIATWNDWGEGTQVEPSRELGFRDLEYLQNVVKPGKTGGGQVRSPDLKIPLQIFRQRKLATANKEKLDRMVQCMLDSRLEELRRLAESTR